MENPLTEEKRAEIKEICETTIKAFFKTYAFKYTAGLVDAARETKGRRASTYEPAGLQLFSPEVATEPLHSGWFEKRGNVRKNWKKRYFVIANESENFGVSYYVSDNLAKKKGTICLDGYTANLFDEKARTEFGEHGIMLECPGRRTWFIRGTDAADVANALPHFQSAAKKTRPAYKAGDAVEGSAFGAAYAATRQELGIKPISKQPSGSEADALSDMISTVVMNKVLGGILEAIPDGMQGDMIRKAVNQFVDSAIDFAVKGTWGGLKMGLAATRKTMESCVKSMVGPLFEAEKKILAKISEACNSVIAPAMDKLMSGHATKISGVVVQPIKAGFVAAAKAWSEIAKVLVASVSADSSCLDAAVAVANKAVWAGSEGVKKACSALTSALGDLGDLLGDLNPSDLVANVLDGLLQLMLKGIATMKAVIDTGSSAAEAYTITLGRMVNDAKIVFGDSILGIILKVVDYPFSLLVRGPCLELVAPFEEMIPDAVKSVLSVSSVMEKVFDSTLEAAADAIANPLTSAENVSLNNLITELA